MSGTKLWVCGSPGRVGWRRQRGRFGANTALFPPVGPLQAGCAGPCRRAPGPKDHALHWTSAMSTMKLGVGSVPGRMGPVWAQTARPATHSAPPGRLCGALQVGARPRGSCFALDWCSGAHNGRAPRCRRYSAARLRRAVAQDDRGAEGPCDSSVAPLLVLAAGQRSYLRLGQRPAVEAQVAHCAQEVVVRARADA